LTDNSLQSADKDQQESCAVAGKPSKRTYDAVENFDMYRNLQRIARFSLRYRGFLVYVLFFLFISTVDAE